MNDARLPDPAVVEVTAGLIACDGKWFIAQRPDDGSTAGGKWEFPGGKIHAGESAEACLARELLEELEIRATVGRCLAVSEYFDAAKNRIIRLQLFEVPSFSGSIRLHAHTAMAWISRLELRSYPFAPADLPFVERLERGGFRTD